VVEIHYAILQEHGEPLGGKALRAFSPMAPMASVFAWVEGISNKNGWLVQNICLHKEV